MRLDKKLLELGLASTRSKAQRLIERNAVKVNGLVATKPSMEITDNDKIDVQQDAVKYVSLGGEKLEAADTRLNIMFNDCRVLGCRCVDRWFHGLRVAKRCKVGLCSRRWSRLAGREVKIGCEG